MFHEYTHTDIFVLFLRSHWIIRQFSFTGSNNSTTPRSSTSTAGCTLPLSACRRLGRRLLLLIGMRKEVRRLFILLVISAVLEASSFTLKMGLLKVGVPMKWDDSKKNLQYIRKAGVRQFVSTYNRVKDLKGDELLWGDEIEYGVFSLDPENKKIRLSLRAKEVS